MKKFLIASVVTLATLQQVSAQEQGTIPTLRDLRNEAKVVIKDFELTDLKIEAGAPEYRAIRDIMHANIKSEIAALDAHLVELNKALSVDYSLIVALKKQKNDAAVKRTVEVATQRLEDKASSMTGAYHARLKSLILLSNYQMPLLKRCLTVLCVEKVNLDFQNWFKKAKSLNRSLDLEVTEMKEVPKFSKVLKAENAKLDNSKTSVSNYLPVAITDEQYEEHLNAERAKEEAAEAARAAAAAAAAAQAEQAKNSDTYACDKLEKRNDEISICMNPHQVKDGQKVSISSSSFNEQRHANVCSSLGLSSKTPSIPWTWNAPVSEKDNFVVKSVVCYSPIAITPAQRVKYDSKLLLEDGNTLFVKPRFQFDAGEAIFTANGRDNANQICKLLGLNEAVNPNGWEYEWQSTYSDIYVTSPTSAQIQNRRYSWMKITCK